MPKIDKDYEKSCTMIWRRQQLNWPKANNAIIELSVGQAAIGYLAVLVDGEDVLCWAAKLEREAGAGHPGEGAALLPGVYIWHWPSRLYKKLKKKNFRSIFYDMEDRDNKKYTRLQIAQKKNRENIWWEVSKCERKNNTVNN